MAIVKQADSSALEIAQKFSERIHALAPDVKVMLYGSAARGKMDKFSDIDIYIEMPDTCDIEPLKSQISDWAWEIGFEHDRVIQTVIYHKNEVWDSPLRSSPFIKAVMRDGVVL